MSDIKWIKVMTDLFANRKIKQIETLPDSDAIIVIWFKLLCLAGNVNDNGLIYFTKEIPYTEEMMATEFGKSINQIRLALQTFERFEMIRIVDNILMVSNWEKYQQIEGMEKVREQNRIRKQRQRERQRQALLECKENDNCDSHVTVTESHATEEEEEKEKDLSFSNKEKDKREKQPQADALAPDIQAIIDAYYLHCPSYPKLRSLKDNRIKPLKKLLKLYCYSDFVEVFKKMESSDFLKGEKGFKASFDWVIKEANFVKVLEGNYDNRDSGKTKSKNQFNNFSQRDVDMDELEKKLIGF